MSLYSQDVREKQFTEAGRMDRGYDEREVDEFLDDVAAALDERDGVISELRRQSAAVASRSSVASGGPEQVTILLELAQRTADEYVARASETAEEAVRNGRREAESALDEARREAAGLVAGARGEAERLLDEARLEAARIRATSADARRRITDAEEELAALGERARGELEALLVRVLDIVQGSSPESTVGELKAVGG